VLGIAAADVRLPLVTVRPETARAIEQSLDGLGLRAAAKAAH
jgi:hypothetical protein